MRREQLDRLFEDPAGLIRHARSERGWVFTIRTALGMSLESFGKRLGVSKQTARQLERAEVSESISVRRLRAAAEALDCELVFFLRPNRPLQEMVSIRAREVAREIVARSSHAMTLEDQSISERHAEEMIAAVARELIANSDRRLWE